MYLAPKEHTMSKFSVKTENPFFTGIEIPDEFFCDRAKETETIIRLIDNGSNIVLKAPRRIGKSSLLYHVFNQNKVKAKYNTLFVDIYGTKNAADFHAEFQNSLLAAPFAKRAKIKKNFEAMAHGAYLSLGSYDTVAGSISLPKIGFTPVTMPKIPLEELFGFLENCGKPVLVVFDEFQQIEEYPERMAAILRKHIQKLNNVRFIFSGSSRHMLTTMFQLSNQPFYKSAVSMDLDILPMESYKAFCMDMFRYGNKSIDASAIEFAYYLFGGETYLMQEAMKESYTRISTGEIAGKETVLAAISEMLFRKDTDYRDIMNRLNSQKERNTLYCIALEGIASGITSSQTMKKYQLDNASAVQNALENLGQDKLSIIERIAKGTYVVQDRLLELWLASKSGLLESKYANAEQRFFRQREISERLP